MSILHRRRMRLHRRGTSLVEVLVASSLIAMVVIGTMTTLGGARSATAVRAARDAAVRLADSSIEVSRTLGCGLGIAGDEMHAQRAVRCRELLTGEDGLYLGDPDAAGDLSYLRTVDGVTFRIDMQGWWDPGHRDLGTGDCRATGNPSLLRRVVTVTWPVLADGSSPDESVRETLTRTDAVAALPGTALYSGSNPKGILLTRSRATPATGFIEATVPTAGHADGMPSVLRVRRTWPAGGCLWLPFLSARVTTPVTLSDGSRSTSLLLGDGVVLKNWPPA